MRNAKKIIGLLLVLVMAISMSIPAFAEDVTTGTITVNNPQDVSEGVGATYKAYKIFDVVYNDVTAPATPDKYAYTLAKASPWCSVIEAYANQVDPDTGLDLTNSAADPDNTYVVTFTAAFSAPDFAAYLNDKVTNNEVALSKDHYKEVVKGADDTTVTITDLALGYYFVTTTTGTICNLTTTNPDVVIYDKNEVPQISKTFTTSDGDNIVEVGETVTFTITGEVPSVVGFTKYNYTVIDNMSANMTFNEDITLQFGDGEEYGFNALQSNGFLSYPNPLGTFVLSFDLVALQNGEEPKCEVGDTITITYTATVNAGALEDGNLTNDVQLITSDDPKDPNSEEPRDEDDVELYSASIVINKYDSKYAADAEEGKLDGAKFVLYKETDGVKEYYKYDAEAETPVVEWVTDKDAATVVETVDGVASFSGLGTGTYYLQEIEAPKGYNILTEDITVEITELPTDEDGNVTSTVFNVDVENNAGSLLPSTGGRGTVIFYVLGAVLVAGAFVLIITKKRMSAEG